MPAFIFISGIFFKEEKILEKLIYFYRYIYRFSFYFNCLMLFIMEVFGMEHFNSYGLLNLIGCFGIYLAWEFDAFSFFPKKTAYPVLFSIILALLIGFSPINNYSYSIGRIFVFLPFYDWGDLW